MTSNCLPVLRLPILFHFWQWEYSHEIWHRKICYSNNEKWETINDKRNRKTQSRKKSERSKKRKLTKEYEKQMPPNKDERKILKVRVRKRRKLLETRNLIKRDKHLSCPPNKILKWTKEELRHMNQRTRKLMTMHKSLYPRDYMCQ